MTDDTDPRADLYKAIGRIAGTDFMPANWVILAEGFLPDGSRSFTAVCDENMKQWNVLGLVHYWLSLHEAGMSRAAMEGEL